jgi:MOSC domain-containing protein YiiM
MAIVLATGDVREEDAIKVRLPPEPHVAMDRV